MTRKLSGNNISGNFYLKDNISSLEYSHGNERVFQVSSLMLGSYNIYYTFSDEGGDADITPSFIAEGISDDDIPGDGVSDDAVSGCVRLPVNARYGIKNTLTTGRNIRITSHGFLFIALSILTHIIIKNTKL